MSIPDSNTSQPSSDNIFKILLATDCHLGYEERASKKCTVTIYLRGIK